MTGRGGVWLSNCSEIMFMGNRAFHSEAIFQKALKEQDMTQLAPRQKTPSNKETETKLRFAQDEFIRKWGEMGATWGISRTMAEIFAYLYVTGQQQCTDDVMERLNISRGN